MCTSSTCMYNYCRTSRAMNINIRLVTRTRTLATPTCVTVGVDVHTTPQGEAKAPEGGDGGRAYEVQHSTGGYDL